MPRKTSAAPAPAPEPTPVPSHQGGGEGVGTQGATLPSIEKDLAEWGINAADLDPDKAEAQAQVEAENESIPDGQSVDPFDGALDPNQLVEPKPDDLTSPELQEALGTEEEDGDADAAPPNKGVPPMHELVKRGLVPDDVLAHVKAYQKGFTKAQQEAAALRKEVEALRAQRDDDPSPIGPHGAPGVLGLGGVSEDFAKSIRELAATQVPPESVFTAEGSALAAKVEAAKLLLPQIEYAQKEAQAQREAQAQAEAQRQARQWVKENAWVMTPGIKEATAEYIKAGMDLESAAWRAYGEHQMKAKAAPKAQPQGDAEPEPTSQRRGPSRRRPWEISAIEIYEQEQRRLRRQGE